ncbi:hypothetical protein DMENIID0001_069620 [Sergentomyia squamirostris]
MPRKAKTSGKVTPGSFIIPGVIELVGILLLVIKLLDNDKESTSFTINIILITGFIQATQVVSIAYFENEVRDIFLWIHKLFQFHENIILADIMREQLYKTQKFASLVLRIIVSLFGLTYISMIIYFYKTQYDFIKVPFIMDDYPLIHRIVSSVFLTTTTFFVVTADSILVVLGIYLIGAFNTISSLVKTLNGRKNIPDAGKLLRDAVIFHGEVLRKLMSFYDIFYYFFLIQIATSVFFLLFHFYLLIYVLDNFAYYTMISATLGQFCIFCIFGQIIHTTTERIFIDLYHTLWYEMKIEDQRILLMMMTISQKTYGLKAAGMYDINLDMFIQVIKLCYSFCTIMYNLA